jgi:hypothetical protein
MKNKNSVTNERTKERATTRTSNERGGPNLKRFLPHKKTSNKLAFSRVQTSQYCDNDDCQKGAKNKTKKKSQKNRGSWRTWRLPGRLRNTTTKGRKEPLQCSLSYSLVTTKTYALYVPDDVSVSLTVHRIRTNPLVIITTPGSSIAGHIPVDYHSGYMVIISFRLFYVLHVWLFPKCLNFSKFLWLLLPE